MKNKALLVATMALPLAFAACVQDEFESNSMSQAQEGELITLPENYLLAGMFGGAAETRSIYHNGVEFAWLPVIKDEPDAIGLCWRGGGYTSNPNVVYTNYKFEHDGWLGEGETAPVLDCDGELVNGQLLKNFDTNENEDALLAGTWKVAGEDGKYANMMVDAKNGVFHTENSTIFKGDYIVYYPYNEQFHDVDYIPATAPTMIKRTGTNCLDENTQKYTEELAKEVFVAGTMTGVDGGQQNGVFSTNFVSGGVIVRIHAENQCGIEKVLLVADNGFATEVKLDAQKIASGAKGAALYAAEPEKFENALIAEIEDDGMTIAGGKTANVVFPVLPTTSKTALKNAQIILVSKMGKTLVKPAEDLKNLVSLAENWNVQEITIKSEDFAFNSYAYDTESLLKALTEHNVAGKKGQTIDVLTKITLDPEYKFTMPYPAGGSQTATSLKELFHKSSASLYIAEDLTLTGKGEIVVPADVQLTFKSVGTKDKPSTVTFDVPVTIEGKGCCGDYPGTVVLRTASGKQGSYVFNKKITNEGTLYLGTDLNGAVDIKAVEIENNGGYINAYCAGKNLVEGSTISIDKLTNTYVARDTETEEEKVNNGRVNIVAKFWDQATEEKENAEAKSKNRVNMTVGELINNENAYVLVGKRTNLYVTGASKNNGRIKVETSGEGTNIGGEQETDGKLQVETAGSIENAGLIENYGVVNTIGSMTQNSDDAVIIEYVGSQFGFNNPKVNAGEYICEVEDVDAADNGDRLAAAIDPNMPTTTVRFVGDGTGLSGKKEYEYNLSSYGSLLEDKKVVVATTGIPVKFTTEKGGEVVPVTIGKTLDVVEGSKLQLAKIRLTVNGDVTVNGDMTIDKYGDYNVLDEESAFATGSGTNVVVNGTYEVKSYVRTSLGGDMTINKDAKAVFNYASYTDIEDLIYIDGTFERVLSSGGQTSNSAKVYCGRFEKGENSHIVNGGPQSPNN